MTSYAWRKSKAICSGMYQESFTGRFSQSVSLDHPIRLAFRLVQHSGSRSDQARCLKQLETENGRLKRAVAELTLDNQILKEAAEGNF